MLRLPFIRYSLYVLIIWAILLVLLLFIGIVLSKLTLKKLDKQDPQNTGKPSQGMPLMRKIYKFTLGITSLYFYISIPIVILLVFLLGGGFVYVSLSVEGPSIRVLIAIVFVLLMMLATIWAMLKSLFRRRQVDDPGQRLEEKDSPELFAVLKEVAREIGTPMVDTVFIVPEAQMAVFERGPLWRRLTGKSERCLILGLGMLNGMTQLQFKSILAHEYGHLNNKDTAGGVLAMHIRRAIESSAEGMMEESLGRWFNPAWLFINAFHRVYLRVSHGAARLQEVMADRSVAQVFGVNAFVQGLSHIIRRSIEFNLITDMEIHQAKYENRELQNLYSLEVPDTWPDSDKEKVSEQSTVDQPQVPLPGEVVETSFKHSMGTPTSAYDSHPAPEKRIEWVKKLKTTAQISDDGKPAWDLLENPTALQELMTKQMHENVKEAWVQEALAEATVLMNEL